MTSIQGILIAGCLLAAMLGTAVFRAKLAYRLLAIVLGLTAIIFVIFPDLTTSVARRLGVGRGTDLLFYVSLIAGVNIVLLLYRRTRELDKKLSELVRGTSLRDAQYLGKS